MCRTVIAVLILIPCMNAFIIPEELPTLLSVIYSNIPPIKLGFDSRFGFGFRLGPHADFQTIIEIGPQENARPIGFGNETVSKRQSLSRTELKSLTAVNGVAPAKKGEDNETYQLNLADILMGRKIKKPTKSYFDEIQFKKVPGIDDLNPKKKKSKLSKTFKVKEDTSPVKISILR